MSPKLFALIVRFIMICLLISFLNCVEVRDYGGIDLAYIGIIPITIFVLVRLSNSFVIGLVIGSAVVLTPLFIIVFIADIFHQLQMANYMLFIVYQLLLIVSIYQWKITRETINKKFVFIGIFCAIMYFVLTYYLAKWLTPYIIKYYRK